MLSAALLICALLQPAPAKALAKAPRPPTRMAQELLSQRPLVAEVKTLKVTPFGIGTAVVRMSIVSSFGPANVAPGDEITVFAYQGHFFAGSRDLVHLLPFRSGGRYRVLARVDGHDRYYRSKLAVTQVQLGFLDLPSQDAMDTAAFDAALLWLRSSDAWIRSYAVDELIFMAVTRPDLFSDERQARLLAVASASSDPDLLPGVEYVTRVAKSATAKVRSGDRQDPPPP